MVFMQMLHYAAQCGLGRIIEILITMFECQTDCQSCTIQGSYNTLHVACVYGHIEIVGELIVFLMKIMRMSLFCLLPVTLVIRVLYTI